MGMRGYGEADISELAASTLPHARRLRQDSDIDPVTFYS